MRCKSNLPGLSSQQARHLIFVGAPNSRLALAALLAQRRRVVIGGYLWQEVRAAEASSYTTDRTYSRLVGH